MKFFFSTYKSKNSPPINSEILSTWQSNSIRRSKPSPDGEARNGLIIVERNIWSAIPELMRSLDFALHKIGAEPIPVDKSLISIGSWIGGDRDGNPFVTHNVFFFFFFFFF